VLLNHGPLRSQTAIKRQRLARVVRRSIGKQPCNRVGNFFSAADSSKRMNSRHAVKWLVVTEHLKEHFRTHRSRTAGISPNAIPPVFDRSGFRQSQNSVFAGNVMTGSWCRKQSAD